MKRFGKKGIFAALAAICIGLLASCGETSSNDGEKWADTAIQAAQDSVKLEESEMLGKLVYYNQCEEFAQKVVNLMALQSFNEKKEQMDGKSKEESNAIAQQFGADVDSARSKVEQHFTKLAQEEQNTLMGKSLTAGSDSQTFDNTKTKAEIVGFEGTSKVRIKVTLTPVKPLGKFFRMVLADKEMKPIRPFALMTTPKQAGETFSTETAVPTKMLGEAKMLLFDAR